MRRFLVASVLLLSLLICSFSALAESAPALVFTGTFSPRGKNITLSVSAENAESLTAFMLSVEYDESLLTFKDKTKKLGELEVFDNKSGKLTAVFFSEDGLGQSGEKKLFELSFSSKDKSSKSFKLLAWDAIDRNGESISLDCPENIFVSSKEAVKANNNKTVESKASPTDDIEAKSEKSLSIEGDDSQGDIYAVLGFGAMVVLGAVLWLVLRGILKKRAEKQFNTALLYYESAADEEVNDEKE